MTEHTETTEKDMLTQLRDNADKRTVNIDIVKSFIKAYFHDEIIAKKEEQSAEEEMFDMLYELIDQHEWRLVLEVYMEVRKEDAVRSAYRSEYTQYRRRVSESIMSIIIYLMSKESIEYVEELIVMYKELAYVIYDEMTHGQSRPRGARNLYEQLKNRPALKDLFP